MPHLFELESIGCEGANGFCGRGLRLFRRAFESRSLRGLLPTLSGQRRFTVSLANMPRSSRESALRCMISRSSIFRFRIGLTGSAPRRISGHST